MSGKHTPGPLTVVPVDHLGDPAWAIRAPDGDLLGVGMLHGDAVLYAAAPTMADYIAQKAAGGDAEAAQIMEAIHGRG